jgi:hypothetical protein
MPHINMAKCPWLFFGVPSEFGHYRDTSQPEIYVRLQRVDVMFSIVYPDSANKLRPVQERRILYLDLADYERLRLTEFRLSVRCVS